MVEDPNANPPSRGSMNRRQFLRHVGMVTAAAAVACTGGLGLPARGEADKNDERTSKEPEMTLRLWPYERRPDGTLPTAHETAEILPGLWYVGGYQNCCYLLSAGVGPVMVDTGLATQADDYIANIRGAGTDPAKLAAILHTHGHPDHTGATPRLVALSGANTYIGKEDAPLLAPRVAVDYELSDGDTVDLGGPEFTFIHIPGHTPGCGMYLGDFDGSRVCFIGDAAGPNAFERKRTEQEARVFRDSAKRMKEVVADVYLPGHPHQTMAVSPEGDPRLTRDQWHRYVSARVAEMEERYAQHSR